MTDRYSDHASNLVSPAAGGYAIVPHDSHAVPEVTRAVYVGSGGNLVVELAWGATLTFANLPSGALLPIRVNRVLTATTASSLVGLY